MTIEYIRYKVEPDQRQVFMAAYVEAAKHLVGSEYCLSYELTECEEEPGQFILRIEWTSTEDHLQGFRQSTAFQQFYLHVKPFFSNIQEMRHYSLTSVSMRK